MLSTLLANPQLTRVAMGLSKSEKQVLSTIAAFGSSIGVNTLAQKLDIKPALQTLLHGEPPPEWLLQLSKLLASVSNLPGGWNHVAVLVKSLIEKHEVDPNVVQSLLAKGAQILEIPELPESFDSQLAILGETIVNRIEATQDPDAPNALAVCPRCHYAHGVRL